MAILIDYKEYTGEENMKIDSQLMEESINTNRKEPVLRFYGWKPACVSFGRNQLITNIDLDFCKQNNIDVVRRVTGGRGLLHDDELTYSFICPVDFLNDGKSIIKSYKEISSAIIESFKHLDIELDFGGKKKINTSFDYCMSLSTGADLCYQDKKIIGSAQYRSQNYILQHGAILFTYNKDLIEKIFNEKTNENTILGLKRINPKLQRLDVVQAMKEGFKDYFGFSYKNI